MAVASPSERVYYYECSNGRFRLTYFIPPGELKRLCAKKRISPQAEKDFPDGVDLGCTEPDFKVFEETYGFRPKRCNARASPLNLRNRRKHSHRWSPAFRMSV